MRAPWKVINERVSVTAESYADVETQRHCANPTRRASSATDGEAAVSVSLPNDVESLTNVAIDATELQPLVSLPAITLGTAFHLWTAAA